MKYKLIKEYPGSPKLNTIINDSKTTLGISYYENCKGFIGNFPEFWELVVEKDYEILLINHNETILNYNESQNDLKFYWSIHSVKRLSDGEIFTIGDTIIPSTYSSSNHERLKVFRNKIRAFNIEKDLLKVSGTNFHVSINSIQRSKILFTTEDGVDIFEGDIVWHTNFNFDKPYSSLVKKAEKPYIPVKGLYSSYEKAEEYILLNKPCLSIKEIIKLTETTSNDWLNKELTNLVKSKIQQSV